MIDLKKLEKKLDDALEAETKESMTEWLTNKRKSKSMATHTPTPWRIQKGHGTQFRIHGPFIDLTSSLVTVIVGTETGKANAERIVSCVNAMAGIEDPQKLRDTWDAIKHLELDAYQKCAEQLEAAIKEIEQLKQIQTT